MSLASVVEKRIVKRKVQPKKSIDKPVLNAVSNRQSNTSLKAILESYLVERKNFKSFKAEISRNENIGFHPSGLYEACPRAISFSYLWERGIDPLTKRLKNPIYKKNIINDYLVDLTNTNNNAKTQLIFDFGHLIHFLIQYSYLPDYGIEHKVEVPINSLMNKYLISGTADIILKLQNNRTYLVDIKTMRSEQFYKIKTLDDVSDKYKVQMALYLLGAKIRWGIFLFVNKNDSSVTEIFMEYNKKYVLDALKVAVEGKQFLEGKRIPEMLSECKKRGKRYSDCPFSSICILCKNKNDLLNFTIKNNYNELIV